jgi:hypothetical protein
VDFTGSVTKGSTTGAITAFQITGTVPTNVPGCTVIGTTSAFPWVVHLTTPDTMKITNVTFTYHFSGESCAMVGLGPPWPIDGDMTLTVTGSNAASANEYDDTTTLGVEPNTTPGIDTVGDITWSGPGVTGL